MSALTHADLAAGTEFYERRNNKNCKMKVTEGPFEVVTMIAGSRRTQWRWDAAEVVDSANNAAADSADIKYVVTDGNTELAPDIFDSIDDLPVDELPTKDQSITVNPDDYDSMEDMIEDIASRVAANRSDA